MSKSRYLLEQHTVSELFTLVYVLVDDYLEVGVQQGRFVLPESPQQKGSYSELMTIAFVGDLLNQATSGYGSTWSSVNTGACFRCCPTTAVTTGCSRA